MAGRARSVKIARPQNWSREANLDFFRRVGPRRIDGPDYPKNLNFDLDLDLDLDPDQNAIPIRQTAAGHRQGRQRRGSGFGSLERSRSCEISALGSRLNFDKPRSCQKANHESDGPERFPLRPQHSSHHHPLLLACIALGLARLI